MLIARISQKLEDGGSASESAAVIGDRLADVLREVLRERLEHDGRHLGVAGDRQAREGVGVVRQ